MAYTTIDDGTAYFQTTHYVGNEATDRVMTFPGNANMHPDLLIFKNRTWHQSWCVTDANTGYHSQIFMGSAGGYSSYNDVVTDISDDGWTMTVGNAAGGINNKDGYSHLAMGWHCQGQEFGETHEKTAVTVTGGNIHTSTSYTWRNTNADVGLTLIQYKTNGNNAVATLTHGLGKAPEFMFFKRRNYTYPHTVSYWRIYHHKMHADAEQKQLNWEAEAMVDETTWNDTAPTSTVFTLGDNMFVNNSGDYQDWDAATNDVTFNGWIWTSIKGFSKFGSYTGNGNADGTFVYTGFKPAMVMLKNTEDTSKWFILDNYRNLYNPINRSLSPGDTTSEVTDGSIQVDFLSNGFKQRGTTTTLSNKDGDLYVYAAWAENPFVSSTGVPTTAK